MIVGTVGFDDAGWYIAPEQPLNISYEYFLDNPSVFPEQTSIRLIDPEVDGMDKAVYLGHTVTIHGQFLPLLCCSAGYWAQSDRCL